MLESYLFYAVVGYLSGSVLYSELIPQAFCNIDIRKASPDGNPGPVNATKLCGVGWGLLCMFLDGLKGFAPVCFALWRLDSQSVWFALAAITPVLGHAFPVFSHFKGGKADSVAFGVLFALSFYSPVVWFLLLPYLFFSLVLLVRPRAYGLLLSLALFLLSSLLVEHQLSFLLAAFGVAAALAVRYLPDCGKKPEARFLVSLLMERKGK